MRAEPKTRSVGASAPGFRGNAQKGRQAVVLPGEKPLSAGQVARLLLEQEMERDTAHRYQTIAEIIRRMDAGRPREKEIAQSAADSVGRQPVF
jgi:hypothetical protein